MLKIGLGIDTHRFEAGRKLILGGIEIPHEQGLIGHSDADCVLHALGDALLGAAGLPDLGHYFPASEENKDRPSTEILQEIRNLVWERNFKILSADIVVMAEEPKLAEFREAMIDNVAQLLNVEKTFVNIKATTCDGLGAIGRKEGITCHAVVLLEKKSYG